MESQLPIHLWETDDQITPFINNESAVASTSLTSPYNSNDYDILAQSTTLPSQSLVSQHHLAWQHLPSSPQTDLISVTPLPELELVAFSDDEEQPMEHCEDNKFFTSHPASNGTLQGQPIGPNEPGSASNTLLEISDSSMQHPYESQMVQSQITPQPISPNVSDAVTFKVSLTEQDARNQVDAWFTEMQQQLSRYPVLRIDPMMQKGQMEFTPQELHENPQHDSPRIMVSHTESIPLRNNPSTPNHVDYDSDGAYLPRSHNGQGIVDSPEHSNVANLLDQLHGGHVEQGQTSTISENVNVFVLDSSLSEPHQEAQKSPSRSNFPSVQQNINEPISRGAKPNPTVRSENSKARNQKRQIRRRAITKPSNHRGPRIQGGKIRCAICPELFKSELNAQRHLQGCHPKKKKTFACEHCSASYGGAGPKTVHMRKGHPEIVPPLPPSEPIIRELNGKTRFFCSVPGCTNSYTMKNNLNRHYSMHHLKIRYPCICGHKATTKHNLQTHQISCRNFRESQSDSNSENQ